MSRRDRNLVVEELNAAEALLTSWLEVARGGAFGEEFVDCEDDCECVACQTAAFLEVES